MTNPSSAPASLLTASAAASLGLLLLGAACAAPPQSVHEPAAAPELATVSLEGWPSEVFDLPPSFAPELPQGSESLRFAPGWRDPQAEGFWSYTFVMSIDEPVPDAARIDELLETYYDGLMTPFAGGPDREVGPDPAQVELVGVAPNRYEARMHVIDAFATFEPIDIRILVETVATSATSSALHIRLSPQPEHHAIWRSLEAALANIPKP